MVTEADEEFNIEKGKLVRQETVAIEAFFQKKLKQAQVQRKITQSHLINKNRLSVLEARQQLLMDLFSEAKVHLTSLSANEVAYEELMTNLLVQSFFKLMETDMSIQVRSKDIAVTERALNKAVQIYKSKLNATINPVIDTENTLPEKSQGGVVVTGMYGRIRVDNTLESRLELLSTQVRQSNIDVARNQNQFIWTI
jgi:V-type H+-transporting ATPase subunit E